MTNLANFALYQVGWFACVLGAAWAHPWLGMFVALALLAVHFVLTEDLSGQAKLVGAAVAIGLLVDSALLNLRAFSFPHGVVVHSLPPPWMSVLWAQFASIFHYSLRWLNARYMVAAVFGLVGAPLAFFAGERLGAVTFAAPKALSYLMLAAGWLVAVPTLLRISDHLASPRSVGRYRWIAGSPAQTGR